MSSKPSKSLTIVLGIFVLAGLCGCGPNAREREAEALFVAAQLKEFSGDDAQLPQARKIYSQLVAEYPETPAGKHAKKSLVLLAPKQDAAFRRALLEAGRRNAALTDQLLKP